MKVAILNVTLVTAPGQYKVELIDNETAVNIVYNADEILSAIGHEATAVVASELLGVAVPVNRIQFTQDVETLALCLKLRGRLPEGVVLFRDDMEKIGYDWWLVTRTA